MIIAMGNPTVCLEGQLCASHGTKRSCSTCDDVGIIGPRASDGNGNITNDVAGARVVVENRRICLCREVLIQYVTDLRLAALIECVRAVERWVGIKAHLVARELEAVVPKTLRPVQ